MPRPEVDAQTRELWDAYRLAKIRAASPDADQFDMIELQIALEEFAAALTKWMAKTDAVRGAVARRTHEGHTH